MVSKLLNLFLIISLLLWIFSISIITNSNKEYSTIIVFFNIFSIASYFYILQKYYFKFYLKYSLTKLFIVVFVYSALFVAFLKVIYYLNHDSLFSFRAIDAINYHNDTILLLKYDLLRAIEKIFTQFHYSDVGAAIYILLIYKVIPSPIALDIINVLFSAFSALSFYKISRFYLPDKFAFITSISFFCSTYVIQISSGGLKEPIFLFLVLQSFLYNEYYIRRRELKYIFYILITSSITLLFRPAVFAFFVLSIGAGYLFQRKNRYSFILIPILALSIIAIITLQEILFTFSSFEKTLSYHESTVDNNGKSITIIAALISGLVGPLPTVTPFSGKEVSSIYSIGLVFRVLLSIPFWLGFFYFIRKKFVLLYPYVIFIIAEIASLIYILESYELRYHLLHLPFIYMISFIYIYDKYHENKGKFKTMLFGALISILVVVLVYWNLRLS